MPERIRAQKPIRIRASKPAPASGKHEDTREHKFVLLYFKNPNATQAARDAGYTGTYGSLAVMGSTLLKKHNVKQQLDALRAKAQERSEVSVEKLLRELGKVALSSMQSFTRLDANGDPQVNLEDLSAEDWACIQELQTETYMEGEGSAAREVKRVKIKLYDKLTAIEKAGKHLGMFDKRRSGDADDHGDEPQQIIYTLNIGGNAAIQFKGGEGAAASAERSAHATLIEAQTED